MNEKLKMLMKKRVLMISMFAGIAIIGAGCALFYPFIGTWSLNITNGTDGSVNYSGTDSITYNKYTYAAGCLTVEVDITESAAGSLVTAGTKASMQDNWDITDTTMTNTFGSFSDEACATLTAGSSKIVSTYSYTVAQGDVHTVKIETTNWNKTKAIQTKTISQESFPVQTVTAVLTGLKVTPVDAAAIASLDSIYTNATDSYGTAIASCSSLTFTANNETDVTTCATDKGIINGSTGAMNFVVDSANKKMYTGSAVPDAFGEGMTVINGDTFYQQ